MKWYSIENTPSMKPKSVKSPHNKHKIEGPWKMWRIILWAALR